MNKRYDNVPHRDLIVHNGRVSIPSIFMFKGGCDELFPFLYACEKENCVVVFENENITVNSQGAFENLILSIYASIAQNHKVGDDYIRYLGNIYDMSWDKVKTEV